MPRAMIVAMKPTSSHPQVIHIGPPCSKPMLNEVRHPARIEMIVNEIAKFRNPPIARKSSWA
jgi:hypothetical protein